jgi:hypothetical protein
MSTHTKPPRRRNAWLIGVLAGIIGLLLVALGFALAIVIPGVHHDKAFSLTVGKPVIVSEQQLRTYGAENGTVYWAGPEADREYELTRSSAGATFVRYLPTGVKAGSTHKYLTVATYPEENGYALLQESVNAKTISAQKTKSGALVVINPQTERSTYFSFPKANFQVEVFSPTDHESKSLVLDGKIDILGAK